MTTPTKLYARVEGLTRPQARQCAEQATKTAVRLAPKLSGASSSRFSPIFDNGYFGITWLDNHVWYQNQGIKPFTNRALAGKVIPMWIDDPTGKVQRENPKAKTRTTESGKTQVLLIRRAAPIGARKKVMRGGVMRDVPASYPGAPGRIRLREAGAPNTTQGKVGGQVARGNVGVRWRHPGLDKRSFLHEGILQASKAAGLHVSPAMIQAV